MSIRDMVLGVDATEEEGVVALFLGNALVPIRKLKGVISRTSFARFRKEGLSTYRVVGLGVCVRPSELIGFLNDRATSI